MPFSSEKLLKELDQTPPIDWAPELKNRKEGFAFLMQAVKSKQLNRKQFRNAMQMLFRMAFPENVTDVLQTLVDLSASPDIKVRSYAVQLAVGVVQVSRNLRTQVALSDAQRIALREAVNTGVNQNVARVIAGEL